MSIALILQFVRTNWKAVTIGAAVLALISYIGFLRMEHAYDESQITKLKGDIVILEGNVTVLQNAIKDTNDALQKAQVASNTADKNMGNVGKNIKQQTTILNQNLANITLQGTPNTCQDTISYLVDAVKGYQK